MDALLSHHISDMAEHMYLIGNSNLGEEYVVSFCLLLAENPSGIGGGILGAVLAAILQGSLTLDLQDAHVGRILAPLQETDLQRGRNIRLRPSETTDPRVLWEVPERVPGAHNPELN